MMLADNREEVGVLALLARFSGGNRGLGGIEFA